MCVSAAGTPYRSLYDFCKRLHGTEINRRAVESMIKSGAFDNPEAKRRSMMDGVEGILKSVRVKRGGIWTGRSICSALWTVNRSLDGTSINCRTAGKNILMTSCSRWRKK